MLPVGTKLVVLLLHPVAHTMMTNTDTTINFTKTERTRFDMVPPDARETGTLDALSPIPGQCIWKQLERKQVDDLGGTNTAIRDQVDRTASP
jgi:hypothetical protein